MAISVTCACGRTIRAKDEDGGKTAKCPSCGQPVRLAPAGDAGEGPEPDPVDSAAEPARDPADAPASGPAGRGLLGGVKAKVQATLRAGKEEAARQARRAQIALELAEKKKELDEIYARIGERVVEDASLQGMVGMDDVLEQIGRLDAELRGAEEEAEDLRRRLE